jgi:DNA-binding NtrC family response regulator
MVHDAPLLAGAARISYGACRIMRLLLTWSDRSSLVAPRSHHVPRAQHDRGPVLRLLEQKESRRAYDVAWVFTTPAHAQATDELATDMRRFIKDVRVWVLPIMDPSDHELLFHALLPIIKQIPAAAAVTAVLSAGTPQAQTLWVVMVKSGLLQARMVQVIPPAFVPHPHPRAIREVSLDIEGFPEIRALREEVIQLRARVQARSGLVGNSPAIEALVQRMGRVALASVPVLVLGETGSGKELVARAIHAASERSAGPFLAENCGALAEGTLESELFGHERGAFTGATQRRKGLFELAHGGTLFLDELGEAGPQVQVRLLRVLEAGVLRRVGGEQEVPVDVRIVTATHRDLRKMAREGSFREDLYYRLKGAVLEVPALRDRSSDLEALVVHFLDQMGGGRPMPTRAAWRALQAYSWPGNVRELRAEVARWLVFCEDRVELEDLAPEIQVAAPLRAAGVSSSVPSMKGKAASPRPLAEILAEVEQDVISSTLLRHAGNVSRTARELGIDRNTLKRKLRRAPRQLKRLSGR